MGISLGLDAFKLSFEISPVVLTGGIATFIPGGALPIVAITEALNFTEGLLSGGNDLGLDDFFAHFVPINATLIDQRIGEYPFANQAVAANAVIAQPLMVSYRMICPVKDEGGYATKLATMTALRAALAQHNASGGTYTCAAPWYFYTNCVMLRMTQTDASATKQAGSTWQLDFRRPLLTLQDAQQAQNNLMSQITAGTPMGDNPAWTGLSSAVGNPFSLAGPSVQPAQSGLAGAGVASPTAPASSAFGP